MRNKPNLDILSAPNEGSYRDQLFASPTLYFSKPDRIRKGLVISILLTGLGAHDASCLIRARLPFE